jgi:succinyl-CoA synthetase alpha subunit
MPFSKAADAGLELVVCITEGIPVRDMIRVKQRCGRPTRLIGPNCPGIVTPGRDRIRGAAAASGSRRATSTKPATIGVVSRSGTLTYEAVWQLTCRGVGQSTCVGIGGDPIPGTLAPRRDPDVQRDPDTHGIIMIGEIGGTAEEEAADWIRQHCRKPVAGFIAGATAPPGRRMGHAGAIISGGKGTAAAKIEALQAAGIAVAPTPSVIAETLLARMS